MAYSSPPPTTPPLSPRVPPRSPPPNQPSMSPEGIVALAVFCSLLSSAGVGFAIIHFGIDQAPPKPAAFQLLTSKSPVLNPTIGKKSTTGSPTGDQTSSDTSSTNGSTPAPAAPGNSGVAHPREAAAAALTLIDTVTADTSYVGPNNAGGHMGMYLDLMRLQDMSQAVAADDGSDPAATAQLNQALSKAFDQAITRSDNIANRATESDASRQVSANLHSMLMQMKSQ